MPTETHIYHRTRRHEALALRRTGMTFRQIGNAMGVTRQRAKQMCDQAYEEERIAHEAIYGKEAED